MFVTNDGNLTAAGRRGIWTIATIAFAFVVFLFTHTRVEQGTVKAGYLWGDYSTTLEEGGLYWPVNPFVSWHIVDCKEQSEYFEGVGLPSSDELTSTVDVSVQFRAIGSDAQNIVTNNGSIARIIDKHLTPKLRESVRNAGRGVEKAEMLFDDEVITKVSAIITDDVRAYMEPRGIAVDVVLLRNIQLPAVTKAAVEKRKVRDQLAEEQKAELRRFETEQQQLVATAQAEFDAAQLAAQKIKALADAEAYRINTVNDAVAQGTGYIQVQTLETFRSMSDDPATKLYFMGEDGIPPLPFLNLNEGN